MHALALCALLAAAQQTDEKRLRELLAELEGIPDRTPRLYQEKRRLVDCLTFGTRTYAVRRDGTALGTLTFKTTLDGSRVVLDDTLKADDPKMELRFRQTCEPDAYLNPVSLEITGEGSEKLSIKAAVKDGKAACTIVRGEEKAEREEALGARAISHLALLRVACFLEAKEGVELAFDLLDSEDVKIKKDRVIKYGGKEKITVGGKEREAVRWSIQDGAHEDAVWVDDGVAVKASMHGVVLELSETK
jgi:hypothetical protein